MWKVKKAWPLLENTGCALAIRIEDDITLAQKPIKFFRRLPTESF